ncbi:MAG: hypothetical protein AAGU77_12285 [Bacillota bacterium]
MKNDYVQESRRFYALAQSMELLAHTLRAQPDRDVAVASAVLADLALAQLKRMDKAIDTMIEEGRARV